MQEYLEKMHESGSPFAHVTSFVFMLRVVGRVLNSEFILQQQKLNKKVIANNNERLSSESSRLSISTLISNTTSPALISNKVDATIVKDILKCLLADTLRSVNTNEAFAAQRKILAPHYEQLLKLRTAKLS
jgi:hypothetical protein